MDTILSAAAALAFSAPTAGRSISIIWARYRTSLEVRMLGSPTSSVRRRAWVSCCSELASLFREMFALSFSLTSKNKRNFSSERDQISMTSKIIGEKSAPVSSQSLSLCYELGSLRLKLYRIEKYIWLEHEAWDDKELAINTDSRWKWVSSALNVAYNNRD